MGSELPEAKILDTDGREVSLRALADDRPLLVAYIRHFG
jgi:hypothetical protein